MFMTPERQIGVFSLEIAAMGGRAVGNLMKSPGGNPLGSPLGNLLKLRGGNDIKGYNKSIFTFFFLTGLLEYFIHGGLPCKNRCLSLGVVIGTFIVTSEVVRMAAAPLQEFLELAGSK